MACMYSGWIGGAVGLVVGKGEKLEAGYAFHKDIDSGAVPSVNDRNEYCIDRALMLTDKLDFTCRISNIIYNLYIRNFLAATYHYELHV